MKYLWIKTTADKYELPVAVADTCQELARICKVNETSIFRGVSEKRKNTRKYKKPTIWHKVAIDDDM